MTGKFGTAINCIDGRIQLPIQNWLKENHDIDYVDTITEHGVVKLFSKPDCIEQIKSKVFLSIKDDGSEIILVTGHHDCEGNLIPKNEQITQIKNAVSTIKSWKLPVTVLGAWVNEQLQVESIS